MRFCEKTSSENTALLIMRIIFIYLFVILGKINLAFQITLAVFNENPRQFSEIAVREA